ncbi:MAG: SH3 domain-containing protein [Butyrivibrio sp.]|uniref:SH3 domain-containing protein n=1 Tax=Butyrivibrio sp. TaxID=28121 RepID=UPI001B563F63|nr:SH3 domain-containing protein [Butyrivibrio sp.]MBP3784980.1 SH3 domain-containing protein [Butyrivibrio sp.]
MKNLRKRVLSLGLSVIVSAAVFVSAGLSAYAYTETTGTVSQDNVKVRESASTTSAQVSSLKKGNTIEIVDEATDASGYVWYKIRVNKSEYGYVRSDLVSKAGGSSSSSSSTTSNESQSNAAAAEQLPATTATAVDAKSATITEESVNVREGAGTKYNSVGKVTKGDTVTITGEATGTDNKTWYQVTFGSSNKTGYVRSDLLQVSEAAPEETTEGGEGAEGAEGEGEATETPEESEASEEENNDPAVTSEAGDGHYSLVYLTDDESGEPIWYLYDNIEGYRVKVNELIDAAKSSDEVNKLVKTNNNYKTILIILAVVIAALVIGLIIMALKLRDSLYYEDEEDEQEYDRYAQQRRRARPDDDEEEDERPQRRVRPSDERTVRPNRDEDPRAARATRQPRRDEDAEDRPVRPRRPVSASDDEQRQARPSRPVRRDDEDRPVRPRRPEGDADGRRSYRDADAEAPVKETPKRRAKNFIGDEDDFEFEFLDLDDDK